MSTHPDLFLQVNNVVLPSSAMSRRLKLWTLTEGFIAVTPDQIDTSKFAEEMESSGDHILAAMASFDMSTIEDWGDLMDSLRNFEQMYEEDANTDIYLDISVHSEPNDPNEANLLVNSKNCLEAIIDEMSKRFGVGKDEIKKRIKAGKNFEGVSVIQQSIELIQADFRDAEDIVSYQEYVIDELRRSIEEMVKTQAATLKEHEDQLELNEQQHKLLHPTVKPDDDKHHYHEHHQQQQQQQQRHGVSADRLPSHSLDEHESALIKLGRDWNPDEDFDSADTDHDGKLSKAEWRAWMKEKEELIRMHNQEKYDLIHELKSLRKSIGPESKELYEELYNGEKHRAKLEEEVVRVTMNLETAQKSLARAKRRVLELETEKHLAQAHWKEKIAEIAAGMDDICVEEKGVQATEADPIAQRVKAAKELLATAPQPIIYEKDPNKGWLKPFLAAQVLRSAAVQSPPQHSLSQQHHHHQQQQLQQQQQQQQQIIHRVPARPATFEYSPPVLPIPLQANHQPELLPSKAMHPPVPPTSDYDQSQGSYSEPYYVQQQKAISSQSLHTPKPIHDVLYPEHSTIPLKKSPLGRPTHLVSGHKFPPSDHPMGPNAAVRTNSGGNASNTLIFSNGRSGSPTKGTIAEVPWNNSPKTFSAKPRIPGTGLTPGKSPSTDGTRLVISAQRELVTASASIMNSNSKQQQQQQRQPSPQRKGFALPTGSSAQKVRASSPPNMLLKELHGWK